MYAQVINRIKFWSNKNGTNIEKPNFEKNVPIFEHIKQSEIFVE